MDIKVARDWIDNFWDQEILPSLSEYVSIPAKSPAFDPNWQQNGHIDAAIDHLVNWVHEHPVPEMKLDVHRLPGKTPTILIEIPGTLDQTVLLYGHMDKQPEFVGWLDGLGPWEPVIRDGKLYGRGGADDGYSIYSSIAACLLLTQQGVDLPRTLILIEGSEESGSIDLPFYMDELESIIGTPDLVIALDSVAGNYDQLWITTSLRGIAHGTLKVEVLEQGVHSGMAGGIVSSSFRILRQLLSRIEDESTGNIKPDFLKADIPEARINEAGYAGEILAKEFPNMYVYAGDSKPMLDDPAELVLNNTWRASMEVIGAEGFPPLNEAGNVLRPYTATKVSIRLPPTTDPVAAEQGLHNLLTSNAPANAKITFDADPPNPGWHAPLTSENLQSAMDAASTEWFGSPSVSMGCGGSIPFIEFLAKKYPQAEFVITGLLGPQSNAHGPNEFLHIQAAKNLTGSVASIIERWSGETD